MRQLRAVARAPLVSEADLTSAVELVRSCVGAATVAKQYCLTLASVCMIKQTADMLLQCDGDDDPVQLLLDCVLQHKDAISVQQEAVEACSALVQHGPAFVDVFIRRQGHIALCSCSAVHAVSSPRVRGGILATIRTCLSSHPDDFNLATFEREALDEVSKLGSIDLIGEVASVFESHGAAWSLLELDITEADLSRFFDTVLPVETRSGVPAAQESEQSAQVEPGGLSPLGTGAERTATS